MPKENDYRENSQAVQSHLGIIQSVIQRMASNSTSCKAWCITLVSAVLVVVAGDNKPEYALIALIPSLLFLTLDAYYLALEKMFRNSYNSFIKKLHDDELTSNDLYAVSPEGNILRIFLGSLRSFSIWPFYLTLIAMILIVKYFVIG